MRDAFAEVLGEDLVGAALAVDLDGELVGDLWGGWRDAEDELPWERDTLVHTYSVSKPFAAIALLLLVDRGMVGLDEPVTAYWPEFAAGGKAGISAGVSVCRSTPTASGWGDRGQPRRGEPEWAVRDRFPARVHDRQRSRRPAGACSTGVSGRATPRMSGTTSRLTGAGPEAL